eukprot:JP436646.1.p2 GENE.JP436646.1~~JP436646.1.p2  ORF type:complete len:230 (+),score=44.04 JP436646.1:1-690(+)
MGVQSVLQKQLTELAPGTPNEVVLFYWAGEAKSQLYVDLQEKVEQQLMHTNHGLKFIRSDASTQAEMFAGAGMTQDTFPLLFVATDSMDRYEGEPIVESLLAFIQEKLEPITPQQEANVLKFTSEPDFNEKLASGPLFVKFFADWCSACKAMKKAYIQSATRMVGTVRFMDVQCNGGPQAEAFCGQFGISGYPTIKLFRSRTNVIDFEAARTVAGITGWLGEKMAHPDL